LASLLVPMVLPPIRILLLQVLPQIVRVLPQIVHRVLRLPLQVIVLLPTALAFRLRVLPQVPLLRKLVLRNRQPRGLCRRSCRNQVLRRRRSCRNQVLRRLCRCSSQIS
jgi:hypothetical protein